MRRLAFIVLALAAACGREVKGDPAPLVTFYKPTGIAFHDPWLLVASSNSDLLYEGNVGGTVIAVDPSSTKWLGGTHVASFAGDLVVTDAGCDPTPYAFVASRYSTALYRLTVGAAGELSCDPAICEIPLQDVGAVADPLAVTAVCGHGRPRVFVAYLRAFEALGWVSEYDLTSRQLRSAAIAAAPVRSFAYEPGHDRLWMTVLATGSQHSLSWVTLGGGECRIDVAASDGGCQVGTIALQQMPVGLEPRGIAFANEGAPGQDQTVRRVYLTGRLYDTSAAAAAGGRTVDFGGLLVVADLVENAQGGVDMDVVRTIAIGRGAGEIRVLPPRTDSISGQPIRDLVAALAADDGQLWLYDDETLETRVLGRNLTTGAPVLGHVPYSIAVDPTIRTGNAVRIYVASFQDSYVTPVDVPLDNVDGACMLDATGPTGLCVPDDGAAARISGGTP